jgi:hypothetical protein
MFGNFFSKLFTAADPTKVAIAIQLFILAVFILSLFAAQGVALAGFADGGIGGGGPGVYSVGH